MRDLDVYVDSYNQLDFEKIQEKYRRRDVLSRIAKYNASKILEIGCGRRSILNDLNPDIEVTVIEPAIEFFNQALSDSKGRSNSKVLNLFFEDFPKSSKYDFVIVSSLLHEIIDKERFIEKILNLLDINTYIYFNVPNAMSFHRLLAVESKIIYNYDDISATQISMQQSSRPFTQKSLQLLLKKNGLDVIENYTIFLKPFTHKQMKLILDNGIISDNILDGLFNLTKYFPEYGSEISIIAKGKASA